MISHSNIPSVKYSNILSKGFTLIEMLVVIGIIAVLSAVMLTQFSGASESALAAKCMTNMRNLAVATQNFGMEVGRYPYAGTYEQKLTYEGNLVYQLHYGWISSLYLEGKKGSDSYDLGAYTSGSHVGAPQISMYNTANLEQSMFAVTNGSLWSFMGKSRSAYVCPSHALVAKKKGLDNPNFSYVMNGYFGYDDNGTTKGGERDFGSLRAPERILLFAEKSFVDNAMADSSDRAFSQGNNDTLVDCILQADADSDLGGTGQRPPTPEIIGFNHKNGKSYVAHVSYADGHCEKLVMPTEMSRSQAQELTKWLCWGVGVTYNGAQYDKAKGEEVGQ